MSNDRREGIADNAAGGAAGEPIRAVALAFRILEFLARTGGDHGVTEIAQRIGANKASVFRHLRTLIRLGYAEQNSETEKYRAGVDLYLLGLAAGDRINLLERARRPMYRLRDRFGHTVTFGQPTEDGILILEMLRGTRPYEIGTRPGYVFEYHATAQGKLALAFGPPERAERVLASELRPLTDHTLTDPEELRRELDRARRQGWAVAPEETLPGINALAAPIFGIGAELVGTITAVGSIQDLPAAPEAELVEAVVAAAREVSNALGYREGEVKGAAE